jgi:hypothetical protein
MVKFNVDRRCPKCGGNIIIDRDYHGWYEQCLQCSFMRDLEVVYENSSKSALDRNKLTEKAGFTGEVRS